MAVRGFWRSALSYMELGKAAVIRSDYYVYSSIVAAIESLSYLLASCSVFSTASSSCIGTDDVVRTHLSCNRAGKSLSLWV